jgi:hypothetical protein
MAEDGASADAALKITHQLDQDMMEPLFFLVDNQLWRFVDPVRQQD